MGGVTRGHRGERAAPGVAVLVLHKGSSFLECG